MGCHYVIAPDAAGALSGVAHGWHRIGWAGVDLFFVLSGFLVCGLLFDELKRSDRIDGVRFLVRRGFKIWPAYFCYIAFVAAWLAWQSSPGHEAVGWESLWPNFLHIQNYLGSPRVHTWSLALEEHFYLAGAAVAALLLPRLSKSALGFVPAWILGLIGLVSLARYGGFVAGGREGLNLFATHLRCDGLLFGALLAWWQHFKPARFAAGCRHPVRYIVGGTLAAAPVLWLSPDHSALTASVGLTAMYVGFAMIVFGVVSLEAASNAARKRLGRGAFGAVARVGFFSYGIYLWHVDLAQTPLKKIAALAAGNGLPEWSLWLGITIAYVSAAVLLGALMSRAIEIPALRLRDRLFPNHSNPARAPIPEPVVDPGLATAPAPAAWAETLGSASTKPV